MVYFPIDSYFYDFHNGKAVVHTHEVFYDNQDEADRIEGEGGVKSGYDIVYPMSEEDMKHTNDMKLVNHTCRS